MSAALRAFASRAARPLLPVVGRNRAGGCKLRPFSLVPTNQPLLPDSQNPVCESSKLFPFHTIDVDIGLAAGGWEGTVNGRGTVLCQPCVNLLAYSYIVRHEPTQTSRAENVRSARFMRFSAISQKHDGLRQGSYRRPRWNTSLRLGSQCSVGAL